MTEYEITLHRSLTQPIMMAGVPREIFILNCTLASVIFLGLHSFFGLPLGLLIHFIAVSLAKKDPLFFEVFRRQLRQKRYYDA